MRIGPSPNVNDIFFGFGYAPRTAVHCRRCSLTDTEPLRLEIAEALWCPV
jgi:hypothetical protein